jgi:MFS family permease
MIACDRSALQPVRKDEHELSGVWAHSQRSLTLGLLLTVSATAFEALAVATVLPAVLAELGGLGLYGWVFSGFMLCNLVSIAAFGQLADKRGMTAPFVGGSALFVAGLSIAGVAPSMVVVVVGRMAQGLGAGAISCVSYMAVARGYPASAQPRMLALLSSAWVVPGLIGPAIAGSVADYVGWRWVFLGLAPLTAIAAGVATKGLRRLPPEAGAPPDSGRIALAIQLATGTALALTGVESHSVGVTMVCVLVGVPVAFPALRGLLAVGTLRAASGTPAAIASLALLTFAFFGTEAFVPLLLTTVRGQPATVAGLALTAATLAWTSGAWLQARWSLRGDRRELSSRGLLLTALGIAGSAGALRAETPVWVVSLAWGVAGLGIGLAYSTLTLIVLERAGKGQEGTAATALQLANVLGVALGTGTGGATLGLLMAAGRSQAFAIAAIDALMVAVAGLGLAATRRLPQRPPDTLATSAALPTAASVDSV